MLNNFFKLLSELKFLFDWILMYKWMNVWLFNFCKIVELLNRNWKYNDNIILG